MNRRLKRLNTLLTKAGRFGNLVDPVGLSDEENDRAWDAIIQKDKDLKAKIDAEIEKLKTNSQYTHEH